MKHILLFSVFILAIIVIVILGQEKGHRCRWELCPYKGVTKMEWSNSVKEYTQCEEGTDCYLIDMLHLEYPKEDADQLHDRLFKVIEVSKDGEFINVLFIEKGDTIAWDGLTHKEYSAIFK